MQISQISLILTNERKTNDMLTIKLPFCNYTVKLIECMIEKYFYKGGKHVGPTRNIKMLK